MGPFEERLNEVGRVRPLVFGPFADVNSEFNVVIKEMAVQGAKKMWNTMLCKMSQYTSTLFGWGLLSAGYFHVRLQSTII